MNEILKSAVAKVAELTDGELALINQQALRPLAREEVFTFKLAACDTKVDRDNERFTREALEQMAERFAGRTVLMDHRWTATAQIARVYAAQVEGDGEDAILVLRCYMPRTEATRDTVTAIESGILRECSVGLAIGRVECSICGADQTDTCCRHRPGRVYDGQKCHFTLSDVQDVYEISLCAVPSQSEAGVVKSKRYGGKDEQVPNPAEAGEAEALLLAQAMQEQEEKRSGGIET